MQKKIIALAVASALTMPALASAAELYGMANLSYDRVSTGEFGNLPTPANKSTTQNQLTSNNSRVGVKGSDDLGGGLTAMFQMEGEVAMDTGGAFSFDRNTFVGLKSNDLGTVLAGNYDTPYKTATRKLDLFADRVVADNRSLIFANEARRMNSINYMSPSFGGVTVALASVFGAETAQDTTAGAAAKGSATSMSVAFEQGPIYVALAVDNRKLGGPTTGDLAGTAAPAGTEGDKTKANKVGFSYSMDKFALNAIVEKTKFTDVSLAQDTKGTNMYLGGKFDVSGSGAVKLAYGKKGATETAGTKATDEVKQITVGYDHSMSKNTTVYALYTKVTRQDSTTVKNADPSALSLGVMHSF